MRATLILLLFCLFSSAKVVLPTDTAIQIYGRTFVVDSSKVMYDWPGIRIVAKFTGSSIALNLKDPGGRYNVKIDSVDYPTLITSDTAHIYPLTDSLPPGEHLLTLHKRTESIYVPISFHGLFIDDTAMVLPLPPRPTKRIEFIGASFFAGYGVEHPSRRGTAEDRQITTNTEKSPASLVGKYYGADYRITAHSGKGLVRNFQNSEVGLTFPRYYNYTLMSEINGRFTKPKRWDHTQWQAEIVVLLLGLNDFSSKEPPLNTVLWKQNYHDFLDTIRVAQPNAKILICATPSWPVRQLVPLTEEVVMEEIARGNQVYYYYFREQNSALDNHLSESEAESVAQGIIEVIDYHNLWGLPPIITDTLTDVVTEEDTIPKERAPHSDDPPLVTELPQL